MSAQDGFSTATEPTANRGVPWLAIARGLLGMVVGGALGTVLFHFALRNGFYAIVLPGAIAGMFCSGFMGRRYVPMGIVCALFTAVLTLGVEWKYFPFRKDESLAFFLANFFSKPAFKLGLIALGIGMGGWFGTGRDGISWLGRSRRSRERESARTEG